MDAGRVENCYFADNSAYQGGAILSVGYLGITVDTCIFKTDSDTTFNTHNLPPTLNVNNFTTVYGSGEKLTFDLKTNSSIPVTNGNISISVYFKGNGEWVRNYTCLSGEGWIPDLPVGSYIAFFDTEYAEFQKINRTITITAPEHTFWFLNYTINGNDNPVIELSHDFYFDPAYDAAFVNGIVINRPVTIKGNGTAIDAKRQARIFYVQSANAVLENLTLKNAHSNSRGGAVYFSNTGSVTNCNFTNNSASGNGGAVYFYDEGTGSVTNCNFTGNSASGDGGAVEFENSGNVTNCNFADNSASRGGAVYFSSTGTVSNCNFVDNTVTMYYGGAVYFHSTGNVTNCNFTNNTAIYGGSVFFYDEGNVTNCNFIDNSATLNGGAVYFYLGTGSVTNCNFTNNKATRNGNYEGGGAVYFYDEGTVTNCNFTNNTATSQGGAIRFRGTGTVTNCNFTGNNATNGSAIYFYSTSATKTVSNSRFLNNRANAEALEITKNDNNITITFTGRNNLLNAIYSREDAEVAFNNVTYWGAKGITTVSAKLSGSNKAAGQNITVGVVVNNELVLSDVIITNESGMIVLDISAGENYYIGVRHDADSYYTEAEKTISNNINVNVTSQTTTNKTVNITAKSNIFSEVMPGKLLFILPNGTQIEATYGANGTWWAEHTFDAYGEYKINATYVGLDNVTINNGTITINKVNSTITLDNIVLDYGETKNVTVTTTGATGITAKIDGNDVTVINNYTIQIPVLDAGTYNLTVTTIPDDDHNPVTKEVNITVNRVNSTLTLDDVVLDYGESKNITVTTEGATGITAKIDGVNVTVNGYTIPISGLGAGNYTLTVTTIADKNHNNITKNATITVNKVNGTLTVNDVVLDYGESKNITVTTEGATGITAKIDGVNVTVNGYTIPISGLGAGNYTLTVTTIADKNHNNITKNATITVNKVNGTLTVNDVVLDYGETKNVTVTTTGATGITAKIDGNDVTVINNYTIQIPVLDAGTYNLTVTTIPDDDHNPVTKEVNITVNRVNSTLTVSDIVFDYGSSGSTVVFLVGAYGVNATVVGQPKAVVKVNGTNITVSGLDAGTYTLTVTAIADKNHNNITKNATITVNKVNGTLTLDDVVLDYGETKNITVTTEGATGITAKIDGVNVTVNDYIIPISGLGAGNYTLTVTTIADKNHNPVTKEANITVNKVESTLNVGDIVFDYGSEGSGDISFTGASEVTANVINQPKAVVSVNDNKITVSGLAAGTYTLNVTTVPDENHTAVTETAGITVNKINSTLTLDDVVLDYGESKNITVTTGGATGIAAKIDGVNVTVNGYTIPISGLGAGNYTLSVTTIPDDNHNPVNVTSKITVNKVESTLTVGDIVFDYDGEGSGDVSFTGASEVTANVINQPKAVVSVNDNKIFVSGLGAGSYTLNVTTVPDENHTAVTETAGITVNKINSTLTLDDVELDYGDSKNVTVATEGATGITAKIDGANVTVNGYTIPISGLGAGNYTLSVTTIPDDNHNPVNVTSKITVNKVESTLNVGDIVFDYDGEGSGDVSFTGASEVTANVINQPKAVVSVNDNKIFVSGLGAGSYTLNVTTVPDENHTAVTETAGITVNKINSTLTLDDVVLDYGETKNITVTTEGATGITAKIDGVNVTVSNYTIPISGLSAGNYTLTVTTIADANHNNITKNATITVNKVNATLTVNDVVLDYGETKNITVTTEGAAGITAKIDGVNVTVNGYTIPISGLSAGNYTLTVTTIADKNHNPVTKEANITVNKLSTEIILANETLDLKVGDEVPVLANLTPAGAGNLTFTSSNEDLVFVEDNVTIVANSQGQAIITVSFAGNENYTAAENKTITVNVELNDASVSVENATLNLKVDETSAINATIEPDTIMLHIKYTSSDDSVAIVDKNGIVTAVGEGRAIITIEVGDDEIYAKNSTTVTVTVNKINTTADVSIPENITVGDNSTVNVILPADATGNVTVKVDGEVVDNVPVKDGNADVTIPSMSAGNHTVEIAYSGDGKYDPVNETKDITVSKNDITPEITIPSEIEFDDNATIDVKLPDDATGNVTLTVDGKEINTVPVTNGTASVKLPALDAGNHTAEIAYSGDDKYKSASKTTTISIDKDSTKITAADVTATYKVDKYLVITLKDSKGNPLANATVTVDLNTIKNYTADENGQIKIKVSNLLPKTYDVKITFAGDNKYLGSDATAKVVVKKATPKITAANKMFKTTTKNKKYTITLKDNTGKPIKNAKVYLKVNGKTYKATTNSKGKATFKITKLSKTGTFKATVTYKGNKYYNKVTKKVTVKVISTWKTISKGSKAKSTVKEIQRALKNNGYYLTAYGHYLKVDGIYWDYTVKAIKQFQKAKGLKVTGKVDEKTAKKLGII